MSSGPEGGPAAQNLRFQLDQSEDQIIHIRDSILFRSQLTSLDGMKARTFTTEDSVMIGNDKYHLFAVVKHVGQSFRFGHYKILFKSGTGFIVMDDVRVFFQDNLDLVTGDSYLLCFTKEENQIEGQRDALSHVPELVPEEFVDALIEAMASDGIAPVGGNMANTGLQCIVLFVLL